MGSNRCHRMINGRQCTRRGSYRPVLGLRAEADDVPVDAVVSIQLCEGCMKLAEAEGVEALMPHDEAKWRDIQVAFTNMGRAAPKRSLTTLTFRPIGMATDRPTPGEA